jgi:hypothetical protein
VGLAAGQSRVAHRPLMLLATGRAHEADRLFLDAQQRVEFGLDAGIDLTPRPWTNEMEAFHGKFQLRAATNI